MQDVVEVLQILVLGAMEVLEVLEVARVSVPDELTEAVRLVSAFLEGGDG